MTRTKTRANANMPNNFVSVLDYGAIPHDASHGDDVAIANRAAIQQCLTENSSSAIIDFASEEYWIKGGPVVLNNGGGVTLQNGSITQVDTYENTLELAGGYASRITLFQFGLSHTKTLDQDAVDAYNAANSGANDPKLGFDVGNNLHVRVTNFPWFRWIGSSCTNGYYNMYSYGGMWMAHIERVWSLSPFSSAFYLAASGGISGNDQLGGSTTTKLYKCFVTDVQSNQAAYNIASGYDTVIIDNCSADRCSVFGFFKARPIHILNCSVEQLKPFNNPDNLNPFTAPHAVINLMSGCAATVDGFHLVPQNLDFTTPPAGTVNSFIYALNAAPLNLYNITGTTPAGFHMLNQEGGESFLSTREIGNGVRTIFGAVCKKTSDIGQVAYNVQEGSISGNGLTTLWEVESGVNTYTITTNWAYQGEWCHTAWLVTTLYADDPADRKILVQNLLDGPDQEGRCSIVLNNGNVCFNAGFNYIGSWKAFNYAPQTSAFMSVEDLITRQEITEYSVEAV